MEENESGFDRSLKPDADRTEAYWKRRNISDHLLLKRARPFRFSGTRQTRNDPDSFVCRLEVRVQNHQFDILVLHSSTVHELSKSILTLCARMHVNLIQGASYHSSRAGIQLSK